MPPTITALPGQPLGPTSRYSPGPGTHIHNGQICASALGSVLETAPPLPTTTTATPSGQVKRLNRMSGSRKALPTLSVVRSLATSSTSTISTLLPEVDAVVLARVTRINPRQATVEILVIGDTVCTDEFQGIIRVQDVRATEKDKVKIFGSFRPGDVVRAQVISLGDQSNYYLSTASNHLGVIMAASEAGNAMYPISWKEFKDPVTGAVESRKVAKPF